jgi:hypothetical protein
MVRQFEDARVERVPTPRELAAIEADMPWCRIQIEVDEGARLSQLRDQDSYSYEIATIFVGADNDAELQARHRACLEWLPLRLVPVDAGQAAGGGGRGHRA